MILEIYKIKFQASTMERDGGREEPAAKFSRNLFLIFNLIF